MTIVIAAGHTVGRIAARMMELIVGHAVAVEALHLGPDQDLEAVQEPLDIGIAVVVLVAPTSLAIRSVVQTAAVRILGESQNVRRMIGLLSG